MAWHPRGEPSWPDWKTAQPGVRVEHTQSGATGALKRAVVRKGSPGATYAVIEWDNGAVGRVSSPAFDLRPLEAVDA